MVIVNFTITDILDKKIKKLIKEKGFQSKAELFRAAIHDYLSKEDKTNMADMSEDEKFNYLTERLAYLLKKKYAGKKLPSLEEQLKDI